jgi:hypothetical protein
LTPGTEQVTVEIDIPMNRNALITPRFAKTGMLHSESTLRTERAE